MNQAERTKAPQEGQVRSSLYEQRLVDKETYQDDGSILLSLNMSEKQIKKLCRQLEISMERFHIKSNRLAGVA